MTEDEELEIFSAESQRQGQLLDPTPSLFHFKSSNEIELSKLTKTDLERMFWNGSSRSRMSFLENETIKKSEVWKNFKIVHIDEKPLPFVKCNKCDRYYSWKKHDGTSTLSSHSKGCGDGSIKKNTTKSPSIITKLLKNPPKPAIEELNKEITIGLAKDIRPLSTVDGDGFKRIAQALINFGSKYGAHQVDDVLQSRVTLKKYSEEMATEAKEKVKAKIQAEALLTRDFFGITFDMWSDVYLQRPFISSTLHYIDDNFVLQHPLLGVEQFAVDHDIGAKKSTENIREVLKLTLSNYFVADQLKNVLTNITAVTDGGANCLSVFDRRYPCKCHDLNLALEWTFGKELEKGTAKNKFNVKKKNLEQKIKELENLPSSSPERLKLAGQLTELTFPRKKEFVLSASCPGVKSSIDGIKALVTYFKQAGLNKHLKNSLKQDVSTRWNSHLIMIESYQKSRKEVKELLCKHNKLSRLQNINDEIVDQLVEVLTIFRECTESLSSDKTPTIHLVAQWREILYNQMRQKNSDLTEIRKLKDQLVVCLDEYFQLEDLHLGAAMLDPRCKSLKFVSEEERRVAKEFLSRVFDVARIEHASGSNEINENQPLERREPKRSRFADLQDMENEIDPISFHTEFQRYLMSPLPVDVSEDEDFDLLATWKKSTHLPILQKVAVKVLAVPASQASDERTFSTTGLTITNRRSALSGSTVADLTYIKYNM